MMIKCKNIEYMKYYAKLYRYYNKFVLCTDRKYLYLSSHSCYLNVESQTRNVHCLNVNFSMCDMVSDIFKQLVYGIFLAINRHRQMSSF